MRNTEEYEKEKKHMLDTCEGWDSIYKSLIEAFDMGIDFQKKESKNKFIKLLDSIDKVVIDKRGYKYDQSENSLSQLLINELKEFVKNAKEEKN